jgi:acetylornithine deacetylase/succinyl-diaminopimelate desuccinylase-like protein
VTARWKGTGAAPPLLLHAHLDVVPVERSYWTRDPFGGEIHDGYLWGRGALDMKHMAVMSALVMARLAREGRRLQRDLIFAGVADEEAGCDAGSAWLVDHHPERFRAEYAVGEAGGFTVWVDGQAIYPVMVAEKGVVWMQLKAKGMPGHGSIPKGDNAVVRLSEAIAKLGHCHLPHHLTPTTERYIDQLAAAQPFPRSVVVRLLKSPSLAWRVLSTIPDPIVRASTAAMLANTANPTMLQAGYKVNVVPGEACAHVDGRSLPGQSTEDLVREVQAIVGNDIEVMVTRALPPVETPAPSPLFDAIVATIGEQHPGALVVPWLAPGFTDAKNWSRLGARCYGFFPFQFPKDGPRFGELFHGHDERIPVDGLKWGMKTLWDFILRFAG